ncbi:hypothetical protein C8J56DRAFT_956340 [Mycena floridula]|nr:hypothetical protein C8J56DRAFT_956340 [Mycena floridula]
MVSKEKDLKNKLLNTGIFPVQVWTEILLNLSYFHLLRCSSVCTFLRDLAEKNPLFSVQLFKTRSSVFVADPDPETQGWCEKSPGSAPVRLHPALPLFQYLIGSKANEVTLFSPDDDELELHTLGLANELLTIPAVERIVINLGRSGKMKLVGLVNNREGIRLCDVFTAMEKSVRTLNAMDEAKIKKGKKVEIPAVEEVIGDHRFFAGFTNYSRAQKVLTTAVNRE